MFGFIRLDRSVIRSVDNAILSSRVPPTFREWRRRRRDLIATAVAKDLGRRALGGGVISEAQSDVPRFLPDGVLGEGGVLHPTPGELARAETAAIAREVARDIALRGPVPLLPDHPGDTA